MAEGDAGRTEVLRPDGLERMVVANEIVDELVAKGFIVIEKTELPLSHEASRFGLGSPEPDEPEEAEESEESEVKITASSKDVSAVEAIEAIYGLNGVDEVRAYIDGDARTTVVKAASERIDELENPEVEDVDEEEEDPE